MNPLPSVASNYWPMGFLANGKEVDYAEDMFERRGPLVLLNTSAAAAVDSTVLISLNYNLPTMIVVATVLFLVIIATAIGNMLVGLSLLRYQNLRTISNYLIGNLALSDFLLATTIFPLSTVKECLGHWVFGRAMCNVWLLTDVLYCTASLWNICVIAFDRFTATLYPIWYREKRSNRQAAMYVATVWLIASSICVPPLLGWIDLTQNYVYDNTTDVYHCVPFQTPSYVLYSASGSFFVPFFLTVFLYVQIFVVLRKRMAKMRQAKTTATARGRGAGMKQRVTTTTTTSATTTGNSSAGRRPVFNRAHLIGSTLRPKQTKQTELEMTPVVSGQELRREAAEEEEAEGEEEGGSLRSLSRDSDEDDDELNNQKRPLQEEGRASGAVAAVRVILRPKKMNNDDDDLRRTKTAGDDGDDGDLDKVKPTKCSARFLTELKLVNWALSSRNGGAQSIRSATATATATTTTGLASAAETKADRRERRSRTTKEAAAAAESVAVNLMDEEEQEEEDEEVGLVRNHRQVHRDKNTPEEEEEEEEEHLSSSTRIRRRRPRSVLRRLFEHRSRMTTTTTISASETHVKQSSSSSGGKVVVAASNQQQQQQHRRFDQREIQATIRMAIIIAFFVGMWLGFFVVYVVQGGWCSSCSVSRELEAFFFWLGYSNSSVNPILYTIFNEDFRRAFQKILGCYRKHEQSTATNLAPRH